MIIRALFLKEFGKLVGLIILLATPTSSWSQVFKCVDETTGKISYTDKSCPDKTSGKHQALGSTNIDDDSASTNQAETRSSRNEAKSKGSHAWVKRAREVEAQPKTEAAKN